MLRKLLLIASLLLPHLLWADPIVMYVNDQKPWGFREDGELRGISVAFGKLLGKAIDHPITVDAAPYHRLLKDFEAGRMDLTLFLKDQQPHGAIPVVKILDVDIVLQAAKGITLTPDSDLSSLRIGKMRGAMYSRKFSENTDFECIEVNSYQQAMMLLRKGRLDAVIGTPMAIRYARKDLGLTEDDFAPMVKIDRVPAWLYASEQSTHKDKIEDIREAVETFTENKVIKTLASTMYQWLN